MSAGQTLVITMRKYFHHNFVIVKMMFYQPVVEWCQDNNLPQQLAASVDLPHLTSPHLTLRASHRHWLPVSTQPNVKSVAQICPQRAQPAGWAGLNIPAGKDSGSTPQNIAELLCGVVGCRVEVVKVVRVVMVITINIITVD